VWNVVLDLSVKPPLHIEQAYSLFKHVGVEINSPAFAANEASYQEISIVVKAVRSAFCTATPPVAGFHVHVGARRRASEATPSSADIELAVAG
jgi:hypothetical protein